MIYLKRVVLDFWEVDCVGVVVDLVVVMGVYCLRVREVVVEDCGEVSQGLSRQTMKGLSLV